MNTLPETNIAPENGWTSWWFQPTWKNISQIGHLPKSRGEHEKNNWNHHQVRNLMSYLLMATRNPAIPLKTNMEPENEPLEEEIPMKNHHF